MLLGFLGGLGRLVLAGFVRCRVVDLADVVGLDRKRLVFHAVSRVRLGLDLAFNDDRRPGLERGGELRLPLLLRLPFSALQAAEKLLRAVGQGFIR